MTTPEPGVELMSVKIGVPLRAESASGYISKLKAPLISHEPEATCHHDSANDTCPPPASSGQLQTPSKPQKNRPASEMSQSRDLLERSYLTDDYSRTGLDVFRHHDKTAPPPIPGQGVSNSEDQPTIWSYYTQRAEHYDKDLVEDANNTVEVLLIFAGLFSAVVTAFISLTYPMLQPDPNDILISIYQELRSPGSTTALDKPFAVPSYAVRVNGFLFAGLFTSMLVALLGILVKQWTRSYGRDLAGVSSSHLRARIRHFRYNGVKTWQFPNIVGLLSILMHLALFLSAVGIIDLLLSTAPAAGYVALSISVLAGSFFYITTLLPVFVPDAPFRSPLSKLLTGIRRRVNRPWRLRKKQSAKTIEDEGLEDDIDQSHEKVGDENSIVRSRIRLDLDIICHLLSTADQSTERWLLDLCFEKLPSLKLLERCDPGALLAPSIIIEAYHFLARGCVSINKKGEPEINIDRLGRARQLCTFLTWYLSLPQTNEQKKKLQQDLRKDRDPTTTLMTLLSKDEYIPSSIAAFTAIGQLEHLGAPGTRKECPICVRETLALAAAWTDADSVAPRDEEKIREVTSMLVRRTECLLAWEKDNVRSMDETAAECQQTLTTIQHAFRNCRPTEKDKKLWGQVLSEKEREASISLRAAWLVPLRTALNGIKRGLAPFRPTETANLAGSGLNLQVPRLSYGSA